MHVVKVQGVLRSFSVVQHAAFGIPTGSCEGISAKVRGKQPPLLLAAAGGGPHMYLLYRTVDTSPAEGQQLTRHLHVTVSQGLGGPEARPASAAHAYASLTTSFR
jgi:hypothetical protein